MENTQNVFEVIDGYDKRKTPSKVKVRPMTLAEVQDLTGGEHIDFISMQGTLRTCKVNGKCKTWKRDPNRFELPGKYGMYEYFTFTNQDMDRLVVRMPE